MKDWFIGTSRRINGVLVMRHYGYFRILVSGRIVHADSIAKLEKEVNNDKS